MIADGHSITTAIDAEHWQMRLDELARAHGIPGAALGILRHRPDTEDEVVEVATGVLNRATGVEATSDSLFQIGSITKVWTATLAAQLVDAGQLDLDVPVVEYLPELVLSDAETASALSMRHLLTHTSGIDGDFISDTGRGDDCLERFATLLAQADQIHPLGATHSYCNSGFSLAGRVIERITGLTWDQALRERLYRPLDLTRTVTLPEEAILHRAAVGHVTDEDSGELVPTTSWMIPRSAGPAGIIVSSVGDVLRFARMHLAGGLATDGSRVLSQDLTRELITPQSRVPNPYTDVDAWGIGWKLFDWDGHRIIGHDGACTGQKAYLRIVPEHGVAVVLLMNTLRGEDFRRKLLDEVIGSVAGLSAPVPPTPPLSSPTVDLDRHIGTYERASVRMEVTLHDDGLHLRVIPTMLLEGEKGTIFEFRLVPMDGTGDHFALQPPGSSAWSPVSFFTLANGRDYMNHGLRTTPKAS